MKTISVSCRLNQEQYDRFNKIARGKGMAPASLLRQVVLGWMGDATSTAAIADLQTRVERLEEKLKGLAG